MERTETEKDFNSYVKVEWHHSYADEPVVYYIELDRNRHELRAIQGYKDGTLRTASVSDANSLQDICFEVMPPLEEINTDPEFHAEDITFEDFENIWQEASRRQ